MTDPHDPDVHGRMRLLIAQRVADAHRGIDDASLFSFVSGSTVEGLADARSDIDMSVVVFAELPGEERLREACRSVGGEWFYRSGDAGDGFVVSFHADGIEVQIGYSRETVFVDMLDDQPSAVRSENFNAAVAPLSPFR